MANLTPPKTLIILIATTIFGGCAGDTGGSIDSSTPDNGALDVAVTQDIEESLTDEGEKQDLTVPDSKEGEDAKVGDEVTDPNKEDTGSEKVDAPPVTEGPFSTTCETTPDCSLPCGSGTCKNGQCQFIPKPGFCVVPAGDDLVACAEGGAQNDTSDCLLCNPEVNGLGWTGLLQSTGFEPSQTIEIEAEDLSTGGVTWHTSTRRFAKGGYSLYAGVEHSGTYSTGSEINTIATLPAISLPATGSPFLSFLLWMETEGTLNYDKLRVLATNQDGTELIGAECTDTSECEAGLGCDPEAQKCGVLLDSDDFLSNTGDRWLPFKVDLSAFRGETMRIRFSFATADHKINGFEGAYLDDLKVSGGCCASDIDCNDGNPCSTGMCPEVGGTCTVAQKAECCLVVDDCDDGNPCTKNQCAEPGANCVFTPIFGCCLDDSQCDDNDTCTEDMCTEPGGTCTHQALCCEEDKDCVNEDPCMTGSCNTGTCEFENTCCTNSFECDDDDPCTKDLCETDGSCTHTPKMIFGCCNPTPFTETFDTGNTTPMEFSNSDTNVGWQIVKNQQASSGSSALYYGDPETMDFDTGAINSGTVTTSIIHLSPGVSYKLKAQLYMDTDFWSDSDIVSFELKPVGVSGVDTPIVAWKSTSMFPDDKFAPLEANISAFAGMAVRLVIRFDTVDKWSNYHEGVYVDDIEILSECVLEICTTDADCNDGITATTEQCNGGSCSYTLWP